MKPKFILLLLVLASQFAKSQTSIPKHLISRIDFFYNSPLYNKDKKGTVKYEYNANNQLISITTFDKVDLSNIVKVKIKYAPNKIIINDGLQEQIQQTDEKSRIITGAYIAPTSEENQFFPYQYKFTYTNNNLSRINTYNGNKLFFIYDLYYNDGNLTSIKCSFHNDPRYRPEDYEITYYDKPSTIDMNFVLGICSDDLRGEFPLFGFPGNILGNQSKNLIKSINAIKRYIDNEVYTTLYNIDYDFNQQGLVSKITINNSTFNITYKN